MAFKIAETLQIDTIPGRTVLIDADVVAYYASYPMDDLPLRSATRRADSRMEQIIEECQAEFYKGFLTGSDNFRDHVATLQRYKGNRYDQDGKRITPQPHWLAEVREYLEDKWGCELVHGKEADDALGIEQIKYAKAGIESIISSIDKDLWIIPGLHHNMNSGLIDTVDEFGWIELVKGKVKGVGLKFFYAQMLMGDRTDWIMGLPKITEDIKKRWPSVRRGGCGATAAFRILEDAETELECIERILFCYESYWGVTSYIPWRTKKELPPGTDFIRLQIDEQGQLLWMQHYEGELWSLQARINRYLPEDSRK